MIKSILLAGAASLALSSCTFDDLTPWSGDFQGTYSKRGEQGAVSKINIKAKSLVDENAQFFQVDLAENTAPTKIIDTVKISFNRRDQTYIQSTIIELDGVSLYPGQDDCYEGNSATGDSISVCPDGTRVSFEAINSDGVPQLAIVLDRPGKDVNGSTFGKEISLDQAVHLAKTQSYTSKIQLEVLLESKKQAKQAHLDLIPHLTLNSVVGLITPINVPNLLTAITDLVPFLFPDRWARARSATNLSLAQNESNIQMKVETISQVEELSILQWADSKSVALVTSLDSKLDQFADEVSVLEKYGNYAPGTSDGLRISSFALKKDLVNFQEMQNSSLRNISETLGFADLNKLTNVNIDSVMLDFSNLRTYDRPALEKQALTQSFNLKQMDFLIASARSDKVAASWSWLNPAVGIGAGMWTQVSIAKTKITELQLRQSEIAAKIKAQVADLLGQWEVAKHTYSLSVQDLNAQKIRLEKVLVQYKYGKDLTALDLVNAVQEENKSEMTMVNIQAALLLLDSRIRKISLGKNYEDVND